MLWLRWTRTVALVIVGAALVFVAWPFSMSSYQPPVASGLATRSTVEDVAGVVARSRCGPAIIDAWHENQQQSGWFGYAPFRSERLIGPESACRSGAQHRLRVANLVLLVVLAAALIASLAERRGWGFGSVTNPAI